MNESRGSTLYQALHTIDDFFHPTFKSAAIARSLLEEDDEWERSIDNANIDFMPRHIRALFDFLLVYTNLTYTIQLLKNPSSYARKLHSLF